MKQFLLMLLALVLFPIAIVMIPVNAIRKWYLGHNLPAYWITVAEGIDQAGGSILYGQEDFTISAYTYHLCRGGGNGYACWFMGFIDALFGDGHCEGAWREEIEELMSEVTTHGKSN